MQMRSFLMKRFNFQRKILISWKVIDFMDFSKHSDFQQVEIFRKSVILAGKSEKKRICAKKGKFWVKTIILSDGELRKNDGDPRETTEIFEKRRLLKK